MHRAASILPALLDLVLPDNCPGCGARSLPPACAGCLSLLGAVPFPAPPDPLPPGLPVPWAVTAYAGPLRSMVVAHKEQARLALARPLGAGLARSVVGAASSVAERTGVPQRVSLVPVPSSARSVRQRGHDPTLRIAHGAARWLRRNGVAATVIPLLVHRRRVRDQSTLSHSDRAANLAGALTVRRRRVQTGLASARPLVVVDDVVTTGATLTEAVRALSAAGIEVTGTAVIAATRRRVSSGLPQRLVR